MKNKRHLGKNGLTLHHTSNKTQHIRYDGKLQFVMIHYTNKTKYLGNEYKRKLFWMCILTLVTIPATVRSKVWICGPPLAGILG